MADQLQLRGGTTTEHATFTGALKEVTVDTTKKTLILHDGATAGGIPMLRQDLGNLPAGVIDNADISPTAKIEVNKLLDGSARQVLQTNQAGTGVEWSDSLDLNGSLYVSQDAILDSDVYVTGTIYLEGATGNQFATAVQCVDPTASRTITFPDASGTVLLDSPGSTYLTGAGGTINGELLFAATGTIAFEGTADDAFEARLVFAEPTADRTITFADANGTVAMLEVTQAWSAPQTFGSPVTFNAASSFSSDSTFSGQALFTSQAFFNCPVVFNDNGADNDIRMEGDTAANLFFLDASADRIGINTSAPQSTFHVNGVIRDWLGSLRSLPQNSQASAYTLAADDTGKHIRISAGGVTIPENTFQAGDIVTVYNDSGSDQAIVQGGSVTLRKAGSADTGNRTLAQYGVATVLCVSSNTFVVSGSGLS
jgi:hypothetical protein